MYEIAADYGHQKRSSHEMQDIIGNEGTCQGMIESTQQDDTYQETQKFLDSEPSSVTNKNLMLTRVNMNRAKGRICFITMIVLIVLSLLLTLGAVFLVAASYANQLAHQSELSKISSQVSELAAATERLMNNFTSISSQLNQIASAESQDNISFILGHLDHGITIQDEIELLQTQISSLQLQIHCGGGPWYRVAHLNMSNPTEQCPSAWREYNTSGVRACGRPNSDEGSCSGTLYTSDHRYSRVCGRVIGYQDDSPDAFVDSSANSANQMYMDGISITYGTSRQHIWSYVAGVTENSSLHNGNCPCSGVGATGPPPFVGNNYYCESGNPTDVGGSAMLLINDPLWDGQQCEGTCCTGTNSPPWFSVKLPAPTTDTIEVRICGNEPTVNEDTPIALLDLYVQYT